MQEYARICIGAYFAYSAYICTPHFADVLSRQWSGPGSGQAGEYLGSGPGQGVNGQGLGVVREVSVSDSKWSLAVTVSGKGVVRELLGPGSGQRSGR